VTVPAVTASLQSLNQSASVAMLSDRISWLNSSTASSLAEADGALRRHVSQLEASLQSLNRYQSANVTALSARINRLNSTVSETDVALWRNVSKLESSATPIARLTIVFWNGSATSVPSGWALCNGDNSTPDLRDRFVVGSGRNFMPGATGGRSSITLTLANMPAHNHSNGAFSQLLKADCEATKESQDRTCGEPNIQSSAPMLTQGNNEPFDSLPPYYALAYIMKL
jgi:microcystin-dependent protein